MTKKKQRGLPTKWFVIAGVIVVFLIAIFFAWKTSPPKQQVKPGAYKLYQNAEYGFRVEYPNTWDVKYDTQVFENGDAIAFRISGPTQKKYTELSDGAQFAVSKPFMIDTDLAAWMKNYFSPQATFSKLPLNNYNFEVAQNCEYMECMRYYFTKIGSHIYGIALYADGTSAQKASYENALIHMLKSLHLDNVGNEPVSKEDAVAKVKALPEVVDYLKRVSNGLVAVNGQEDNVYMVQVYEFKDKHTATFNWYSVDKTTGEVRKEF